MGGAELLGMALGVTIAGTYILLGRGGLNPMRRPEENLRLGTRLGGATVRILFLAGALAGVGLWTDANTTWLVGSIAAVYGVWFTWRMRQLLSDLDRK